MRVRAAKGATILNAGLANVLLVGSGGFIGSVLRYVVGGFVHRLVPAASLPYGTLAVNVLGCFVIGFLGGVAEARQAIGPGLRLFVFIGILGGFTTFSTFGYETLALVRDGAHLEAGVNVVATVALCLVAVWAGFVLGMLA
jgi:CrcB protein